MGEPPAADSGGPLQFAYTTEGGGALTLTFPAPADAPWVAEAESIRNRAGAPPVEYVAVRIDNTAGSDSIIYPNLSVVSSDGSTTVYDQLNYDLFVRWRQTIDESYPDGEGIDEVNAVIDLGSRLDAAVNTLPGAVNDALYVVRDEEPLDVTRVFIDAEEATNLTNEFPSEGYDGEIVN